LSFAVGYCPEANCGFREVSGNMAETRPRVSGRPFSDLQKNGYYLWDRESAPKFHWTLPYSFGHQSV